MSDFYQESLIISVIEFFNAFRIPFFNFELFKRLFTFN